MTNSDPTFSVIIPNYNNGDTLARAIESVVSQSYPAYEIIVIDDGSRDNSKQVVERFGTAVRYAFQSNAGVSAARNHGARIATGNWLAFLDADDCYLPNRLEAHVAWIRREPDIDFLLGDQEFRNPDGGLRHLALENSISGRRLVERGSGDIEIPMYEDDFEDFIADGFGEIRTLSVSREKFLTLGGFPVGKKIGEDLHFVIRLCAASKKAGVVNLPLAIYYIYPSSTLRKNVFDAQKRFIETLEVLENEINSAPHQIKRGYREKLRRARLSLAYSYLKENRRMDAFKSIWPTIRSNPGFKALRDFLSIARGIST